MVWLDYCVDYLMSLCLAQRLCLCVYKIFFLWVLTRANNEYDVDLDLWQDVFWLWSGCLLLLLAIVASVRLCISRLGLLCVNFVLDQRG